jgi:hypothetical protein
MKSGGRLVRPVFLVPMKSGGSLAAGFSCACEKRQSFFWPLLCGHYAATPI